jgi:DNA-binding response OmpR family regulator
LQYSIGVTEILIIEDDPINQMILADLLAANGYVTQVASTAVDGLAAAQSAAVGLVIVDVQLPGQNGFEVCAQLKASLPRRPVLLMSAAYSDRDQSSRTVQLGVMADGYLAKPFDLKRLLAEVKRLLGSAAPR